MAGRARVGKLALALGLVAGGAALFFAGLAAQPTAEDTLVAFFEARATGDVAGCLKLLTPARARIQPQACDDANVRALRLLRVWRGEQAAAREREYLQGRPALDAARFLRAEFEVVFEREHELPSGRYTYTYVLVKETPTGPWRIADWSSAP